MNVFYFIFSLGVVYIVFSILWFFIASIPKFLSGRTTSNPFGDYAFKSVQYYLIAALTAVNTAFFLESNLSAMNHSPFYLALGGIVMFLYLAGKTDKAIMNVQIHSNKGQVKLGGALKYEPHIVGVAVILYLICFKLPLLTINPLSIGLHKGILNFYNTFFIHFIIGIAAFFFLISMFIRGFAALGRLIEFVNHIITGKPLSKRVNKRKNPFENMKNMGGFNNEQNPFNFNNNLFNQNKEPEVEIEDDEYVDFEEVEDNEK